MTGGTYSTDPVAFMNGTLLCFYSCWLFLTVIIIVW